MVLVGKVEGDMVRILGCVVVGNFCVGGVFVFLYGKGSEGRSYFNVVWFLVLDREIRLSGYGGF